MGNSSEEKQQKCSGSGTVKAVVDADDEGDQSAEKNHLADRERLFFSHERFSKCEIEGGTGQDHENQALKIIIV